jgi:hypothetical protein
MNIYNCHENGALNIHRGCEQESANPMPLPRWGVQLAVETAETWSDVWPEYWILSISERS